MNEQRKLRLSRETLRELTSEERSGVVGGTQAGPTASPCPTDIDEDPSDHTCTILTTNCATENNSAVC